MFWGNTIGKKRGSIPGSKGRLANPAFAHKGERAMNGSFENGGEFREKLDDEDGQGKGKEKEKKKEKGKGMSEIEEGKNE